LGTGTFSTVRVATHKETGMQYAVKAINLVGIQPQTLVRLRREIQVLRSLNHKNIIQLYEIFEEDGKLFMIMELCTGGELWHFLQRVELSEKRVARIIKGIVEAIHYCHQRHVAHRDLKLENLMLESEEEDANIKLIDFGFSKVFSNSNGMYAILGSPYYVAPEDARGGQGYGCACDMWSIGVITFMILCGQAPFDGENDHERLLAVKRGNFTYPPHGESGSCTIVSELPTANLTSEAVDFINALLTVDPAKRLTAKAALSHAWLRQNARDASANVFTQLKRFASSILRSIHPPSRHVLLSDIRQMGGRGGINQMPLATYPT
ncbi:hypothetical protein GUITHDRAFT_76412, partial [Guillardia theta CCMP2712]